MSNPRFTYFISCDWGTSNFRLKLVKTHTLEVLAVVNSSRGIKKHYSSFLNQNTHNKEAYFCKYLKKKIGELPEEHRNHPVVITGMASSNIGLFELPYSDFPILFDGTSLIKHHKLYSDGLEILLISGARSESGMIRGEETQAVGIANLLNRDQDGILILPGTHSKHLSFAHNRFIELKNFMTGELFEVLITSSILAQSVKKSDWSVSRKDAFRRGLNQSQSEALSSSLISIRADHILKNTLSTDNYYQLSGLLIGNELAYLKNSKQKIFLAASNSILELYKYALPHFVGEDQVVCFSEYELEQAVLIAQKKILLTIL